MAVYKIDPLQDSRWSELLQRHPNASVFHTPSWLEALRRTYGYEPVAFTTSPPGAELMNGVVFCQVKSWLTGTRLVSLPFSDHCAPLLEGTDDLITIADHLRGIRDREGWGYIELRPLADSNLTRIRLFTESETYYLHVLDLRGDREKIFRSFHKRSVQEKIGRAERRALTYERGGSPDLLTKFYCLLVLTRRRHQLPPQPLVWFQNLIACLGESLKIQIASKDGVPIAGTLTLLFNNTMVSKYGCSDARFHNLGGNTLLLWRTIQEAKELGAQKFDLGRSEQGNKGLIAFKESWGATVSTLTYYRYPGGSPARSQEDWWMQLARQVCSRLPDSLVTLAGQLLYRHMG